MPESMTGIVQMLHKHLPEKSVPPQCVKGLGLILRRCGGGSQPWSYPCVTSLLGRAQDSSFLSALGEAYSAQGMKAEIAFVWRLHKCGKRK